MFSVGFVSLKDGEARRPLRRLLRVSEHAQSGSDDGPQPAAAGNKNLAGR